jgi:hypothetical protein
VRYMMLIYGDHVEGAKMTEAEQAANMDYWTSYTQDFAKTGKMLGAEALMPVTTATTVRSNAGGTLTTDGPFAETKEALGGYYIIDAANLDEAIEWAGKMPIICNGGGCVEIRPIMEFS